MFQQSSLRAAAIERELTDRIARQEQHYTALIAEKDQNYLFRLGKQLGKMQKLMAMLDEVEAIAARLQSSRFWRFANKTAAIEAKLIRNNELVPDLRFHKVLARYSRWRASHLQIANNNEVVSAADSPLAVETSDPVPENQATQKPSGNSANA